MTALFTATAGKTAFANRSYNTVVVHRSQKAFMLLTVPRNTNFKPPEGWQLERNFGPYDLTHMGYSEAKAGNAKFPEISTVPRAYFT